MQISLGNEEDSRRYHVVKWDDMKMSMKEVDLGQKSVFEMNTALHGK